MVEMKEVWHPIETAPKDKYILAKLEGNLVVRVIWKSSVGCMRQAGYQIVSIVSGKLPRVSSLFSMRLGSICYPMEWMPVSELLEGV